MKKIILSIGLFILAVTASAQLTSTLGKPYTTFSGINYIFIFDGITPSTEITYTGTYTTINWYKFTDKVNSISNAKYLSPEDSTGYILNVDGKETTIWVIDYKNYRPTLNSIKPEINPTSQCENVNLLIDANVPSLNYQTPDGIVHNLYRDFNINYTTLKWGGTAWQDSTATVPVTLPATNPISVPAPYCSTTFTLTGDQFATDLGIDPFSIKSTDYPAVAVKCHLTAVVTARNANNEELRPANILPINYSAPIDIQFLSNANAPIASDYNWEIFKNNDLQPYIIRTDQDIRNAFTEAGSYKVKVTASNATCSFADSITVTVSESQIQVPIVFTPNGDGMNDEFRIAYKSITTFEAWVYNRWGRLVFHWNDPTKGWDGNINGRQASPGAYFYVIKALGSDFNPNSKPDKNTHLRVGEYLLKGDINLLRGE